MKQTEIGMIPDDWEVKNIGTTCNVFTGGEVPLKYSKDKNEVFKYPIYSNGRDVYGYYTGFVIGDDSVCISSIGENTGDVFFYKGEFTPVIRLKVVVPKSNKISTKYLYYYLKAHKIDGTKNGGIPNINANDVKILNFPLPPTLAEQQKIAKALSDVDNVIITLEKLITKKKNLKQGTMQQLLTGKKRLPGFAKSDKFKQTENGEIPEDWEVKEFCKVATLYNGRAYSQEELLDHGKYKVLRVGNFGTNDTWYFSNLELPTNQYCNKGDLLYCWSCTYGAYIWNEDTTIYHYHIWKIIEKEDADKNYLKYILNNDIEEQMNKSNGSTMAHITKGFLEKRKFIFPSKPEQIAIANVLSSMDKEIEALETKLGKYRDLKTGMMQQLLTGKIRLM